MKNIYNPKYLKNTINDYGYKYNYSNFLFESLLIIVGIIVIAYLYGLESSCVCLITLSLIIMIPSIISGWFKALYNLKRFAELTDYLTNAIPIFICKPKINYVLKELEQLTSGKINHLIKESISYINNTVDDINLYENGLKIISNNYPNSRVLSLHKFLISVEKSDSNNYRLIADTLYNDIENWIKRVLTYQKELIDKRNKLVLLSLSTLIINSIFVYIYRDQDFFKGFVNDKLYQISTTIFIILISLVITLTITKLSGSWLIDDLNIKDTKTIGKAYINYLKNDTKLRLKDQMFIVVLLSLFTYLYLKKIRTLAYLILISIIILLNIKRIKLSTNKKRLSNYFKVEFPLWIRDISLLIGNYTVLNAIKETVNYYKDPLKNEIKKFINEALLNPLSIKPYNNFLEEYTLESVKSNMRILYSLNGTDNENVKERLSLLSDRNQELLAKSENIKNKNSMFLIEMLGFLPTILFLGQTIISMAIMFKYVVENLGVDKYL